MSFADVCELGAGTMKLDDAEWLIVDALGHDNQFLDSLFLPRRDFEALTNLAWHGLDYRSCLHALAHLADLGVIEVIHAPPRREHGLALVIASLTQLGGSLWLDAYSIDPGRFIDSSAFTPNDSDVELQFRCTAKAHLTELHRSAVDMAAGAAITVSAIREIHDFEFSGWLTFPSAFSFTIYSSAPGFQESDYHERVMALRQSLNHGWRKTCRSTAG